MFAIAKRSGGDLVKILGKTAGILRIRSQLREEIITLMAGKRLEQRIMSVMPAAVLLYVNLGNPGFTDPLYQGIGGRCIIGSTYKCTNFKTADILSVNTCIVRSIIKCTV